MPALIIALIVALSGGTSVVAEQALPGDALYSVKVSVNEPIAGLFSVSKEAKTTWQEKLVERRLEEAGKLASKGNLDEEKRSQIETRLGDQIDRFTEKANELASDKNKAISSSELVSRLEAALMAHQNVLRKMSENTNVATSTREEIVALLASLKNSEGDVKGHRDEIDSELGDDETATSTMQSALGKQGAAENVLDSAKRAYERVKSELSAEVDTKVNELFAEADTALLEGKAKLGTSEYSDAREKFQKVIKLANEGRVVALTNSISRDIEDDEDEDNSKEDRDDNATSTLRRNDDNEDREKNENASSTRLRDGESGRSDDGEDDEAEESVR
jgi:hypothetical protein